ncbi:MAG: hypothetical protein SGI91_00875 [Alphaproteobacteria bacterium]|jgi:hypothetical protein|nr:hypothetical protein [Alphaproteobacteria bacterium]
MCSRIVELVALGPELRRLAEHRGEGVNEALFLVHQVLEEAFLDLHTLPNEGLREHLTAQMEYRLDARAAKPAPELRLEPMLWRFTSRPNPPQKTVAAAAQ